MITIDDLKKEYLSIDYFGLGFIQLKIDINKRIHFYTGDLPPIVSEEEVHNHRYDFVSEILKGSLYQEIFDISEGDSFFIEKESCKENCVVNDEIKYCNLELNSYHNYEFGSKYFINHKTFHRVKSTNCITLINRTSYKKEFAEVIRPINSIKICPFSKKIEEKYLWEIVEKMLK